jgi:leukotriene-A4 hydrolase
MAHTKGDPRVLDFDAMEGRKALSDSIQSLPPEHTTLVLDIGDDDPDDAYSVVAYEKGFTFLLYLERLVGTPKFEAFFRAYIARFSERVLTSDDFKAFFLEHFRGEKKIGEIDWDEWFYGRGMPPVLPPLDQSMAKASQDLASIWIAVDRGGHATAAAPSTNDLANWSSPQIVCFLDALHVGTAGTPLRLATLRAMDGIYNLSGSMNSEILMRYCELAIPAEDVTILPVATRFITTQGRMKFVRPLYKLLHKSEMGRELAVTTFLRHKDFYHPICAKMVAIDLKVSATVPPSSPSPAVQPWLLAGVAVVAGGILIALLRTKRK